MVNIIHDYIHEYDFPYHDILKLWKEDLLNFYLHEKKDNPSLTDLYIPPDYPLVNLIEPKLNQIVEDNYLIGKPLINPSLRIYVQNNVQHTSFYHHHLTPSTISGVFYIDPPKEGGEISFLLKFDNENKPKELILKPEKNKLYLFPYWLYHKPQPQKDKEYRICFNWMYGSPIRPFHKITGISW